MSKSTSGRVLVDISPVLKQRLYVALAMEGKTMKEWFCEQAEAHIRKRGVPPVIPRHQAR